MKQYIATCRYALESGLLMRELEWRRHLVHSTEVFSLNDLIDINNGQLLSKIESVHSVLRDHITKECTVSWNHLITFTFLKKINLFAFCYCCVDKYDLVQLSKLSCFGTRNLFRLR